MREITQIYVTLIATNDLLSQVLKLSRYAVKLKGYLTKKIR